MSLEDKVDNIGYSVKTLSEKLPWTFNTVLSFLCIFLLVLNMVILGVNNMILKGIMKKCQRVDELCLDVNIECPEGMVCDNCNITVAICDK